MASLLLHGLFISGLVHFTFPHLPREEKTLEIIWVEPRTISSREISPEVAVTKKKVARPQTESFLFTPKASEEISKIGSPEVISPKAIVPTQKERVSLAKIGTVFLLDASESMVVGLEQARQILKDKLNGLPGKTLVNIAYFSKEVIFFSPEPFILAKEEKEKALTFCQEIKAQGNLQIADGLREIVKRNPSKVILVSDGLVEDRETTYKIIREARREGVIIDTILIQRNPFEDEVLKRAAYLTGGSFSVSPRTF